MTFLAARSDIPTTASPYSVGGGEVGKGGVRGGCIYPLALFHTFPNSALMDTEPTQTDPQEHASRRRWWQRTPKPTQDPSIASVMAQWGEYELIFNDILVRLNAQLARQAKMHKRAIEKIKLEGEPEPANGDAMSHAPPLPQTSKQALRSAWAAKQFGARIQALVNTKEARE